MQANFQLHSFFFFFFVISIVSKTPAKEAGSFIDDTLWQFISWLAHRLPVLAFFFPLPLYS